MMSERSRILIENGVDYEDALNRFDGNDELFEKLVLRFLEDGHFVELQQAIAHDDAEAGYRAAHTLKGVVGNLSFSGYLESIDLVTEALKRGDLQDAKGMMASVEDAHSRITAILHTLQ